MRKDDLLAGVKGGPVPFDVNGFAVYLRPLTSADRLGLFVWHRENKKRDGAGNELQHKLIALAVVDPDNGGSLLTEADAALLPALAVDAISEEVARRNGIGGKDDAEGKASPATPN